jgi:aspartyl protease family protein
MNPKKLLLLLAALACLPFAGTAAATEVHLVGLAEGMAVLIIDGGRPRTLRTGQSGPGGVKLISADSEQAVVEVDGERRRLTLERAAYAAPVAGTRSSARLVSDGSGHFVSNGTINGASMRFMVDTGASLIAMGLSDARRAGINYLAGEKAYANTANGVAPIYRVRLDNVRLGDIVLNNVEAMVHATSDLPIVLLGMSFLGQLDMKREGEVMTLTTRY